MRESRSILRGIDLDIGHGNICAVVGPSGAGKTTLLRAISGLVPYQGVVRLNGNDVGGHRVHRRGTAMLFQEPRLFDNMSVLDNVAYAARLRGVPKAQRRQQAHSMLAEVGLGGRDESRPRALSGGERQRVALARALTASPEALLLDEPLNSVDGPRRIELRTIIADACRSRDLTTLVVTHDLDDALAIADVVAVIIDGLLVQFAAPAELLDRPASLDVSRLIGNPNLVVRHGVRMTVRPERVRLESGGHPMSVASVHRHVTHDSVGLASPWGLLHAHVLAGHAPEVHATVPVIIADNDWWTFPDQVSQHVSDPQTSQERRRRHDKIL